MRWNYKPSKPAAIFGAFVGLGMLVVGVTSVNKNIPFLVLWCVAVIGITVMNLWAAFSSNGSLYSLTSQTDDQPPRRSGKRPSPEAQDSE